MCSVLPLTDVFVQDSMNPFYVVDPITVVSKIRPDRGVDLEVSVGHLPAGNLVPLLPR